MPGAPTPTSPVDLHLCGHDAFVRRALLGQRQQVRVGRFEPLMYQKSEAGRAHRLIQIRCVQPIVARRQRQLVMATTLTPAACSPDRIRRHCERPDGARCPRRSGIRRGKASAGPVGAWLNCSVLLGGCRHGKTPGGCPSRSNPAGWLLLCCESVQRSSRMKILLAFGLLVAATAVQLAPSPTAASVVKALARSPGR